MKLRDIFNWRTVRDVLKVRNYWLPNAVFSEYYNDARYVISTISYKLVEKYAQPMSQEYN